MNTSNFEPIVIPQLEDNYSYLLQTIDGEALVIDPSDEIPILRILETRQLRLRYILNTHHHSDHTQANLPLKKATGAQVLANRTDADRIPGVDQPIDAGRALSLIDFTIDVVASPGHTQSHLLFSIPSRKWLFSGDTLFLLSCGRLFEGTPDDMVKSLHRIRELADDTKIYCGHEYTLKNILFAESLLGDNDEKLLPVAEHYRELREHGLPTVPGRLSLERHASPYFRLHEPKLKESLGLPRSAGEVETLAALRARRDVF